MLHFGGNHIYHWMETGIMDQFIIDENGNELENPKYDKIMARKKAFLNTSFFIIRSIIYIIGWIYFGRKLKQLSINEDKHGGLDNYNKGFRTSSLVYGVFCNHLLCSILGLDYVY